MLRVKKGWKLYGWRLARNAKHMFQTAKNVLYAEIDEFGRTGEQLAVEEFVKVGSSVTVDMFQQREKELHNKQG